MNGPTAKAKKRLSKKARQKRVETAQIERMRKHLEKRRMARAQALEAVMKEGKDTDKLKRENALTILQMIARSY